MNKLNYRRSSLIMPALLFGMSLAGVQLNAQSQSPPTEQQRPNQTEKQTPDSQAQPQQDQVQTFAGTIAKAGDKYVLQEASGNTYDVDRQDLAKKHEGQKVRINGTLDPDGKTIHVK
jgi:uncharacterized protein YdeI (BOF family)